MYVGNSQRAAAAAIADARDVAARTTAADERELLSLEITCRALCDSANILVLASFFSILST